MVLVGAECAGGEGGGEPLNFWKSCPPLAPPFAVTEYLNVKHDDDHSKFFEKKTLSQ